MAREAKSPDGSLSKRHPNGPRDLVAPVDGRRRVLSELASVALLAVVIRGIYLYQLYGTLPFSTLILDGRVFVGWAQNIAAGDWLGTEVFYQAPLYPYFLAAIYRIAGHHVVLVRVVQAALSVGSCVLLAWAGWRFFGARTGVIAGVLMACYPPAFFFDSLVQKAALDVWFMTLLLALLGELLIRRKWYWLLGAGFVLGSFTLNRENAGLIYPILAVWLWFGARGLSPGRRLSQLAVFTAGVAVALLPVACRNYYVGREFVLTTSFGPNFYIGNHAGASGRYEPLAPDRADPRFERVDATRFAEDAAGRRLSMSQVSFYWLKQSLEYIRREPGNWLRLLGWKLFLVFNATELEDGEGIEVYSDYSSLLRVLYAVLNFGVIMPMAAFGIWTTRREWRRLLVLYAIAISLAGSTALFFVFARYRFTFVPIVVLFAAAGLTTLPAMISSRMEAAWLRAWGPGLLVAVTAALVCNQPLPLFREEAVTYVNLGMGLLADQRPAEAIEPLRKAIALKPSMAGAHHNLGQALLALKRDDEAIEQFELAVGLAPDFGMAHAVLGQYYFEKQLPVKALPHLTRAVELVPEVPVLRVELAGILAARNDAAGAITQLREGLRRDPDSWACANNLAWILATDSDPKIRDGAEALRLAEQLVRRAQQPGPSRPDPAHEAAMLDTLAAAYADLDRYDEALETIHRALAIARGADDAALIDVLESRLKLYAGHQPYRS